MSTVITMIQCPKCAEALQQEAKRFVCKNNHSFDIAKEGYVNLLLKNSTNHGDNKAMVQARSHFLNQDYYKPLAELLIQKISSYALHDATILDLGCGQGYYTSQIQKVFTHHSVIGVDISKEAIAYASKQNKQIQYIVASNANLPLADDSINMALCLFSFLDASELQRVIKDNGYIIVVNPHTHHLFELKQAVYDTPYVNELNQSEIDGFKIIDAIELTYPVHINSNEAIKELFQMTPYAYKTSKEDTEKLNHLQHLDVRVSFYIQIYQKQSKSIS